jgi:hypothetical protein
MRVWSRATGCGLLLGGLLAGSSALARVLDDFNDNVKTDWEDFTFIPGFGIPSETGGRFVFDQPLSPLGSSIFSASQKRSELFELKEGRTVEFRVDVIESSGEDAFAVLGFLPSSSPISSLAGYAIAKDPTDVLITKGLGKYFVEDDGPTAALKNENITLVLSLTVKGGNVIITGRVLDKDAGDAVIWERTVVDTPAEDPMEGGTDTDPSTPFITSGYFTLMLYQEYDAGITQYRVAFDNAEVYVLDEVLLDDFNDNAKTDWEDFTFQAGFGLPVETGGRFVFDLPPAGQDIFTASRKVSQLIELVEGERVELQVDVIESSGEDAFAVVAFIPTANPLSSLAGYGLAKDPDDVLITKGILKYFVADAGVTAELKNENITLVLSLTVKNGNVIITGRVLDKDAGGAVLWERTVVDTPAADPMQTGTDTNPSTPFITTGFFALYCYQQYDAAITQYRVAYDDAIIRIPPAPDNTAPLISELQPAEFSNFLPATTSVSFKVADDKPLPKDKIQLRLNGQAPDGTPTLVDEDPEGHTVRYTLAGGLVADVNYVAEIRVEDSDGEEVIRTFYFDTFVPDRLAIEVEDYNYWAGYFIDDPIAVPEGGFAPNSYSYQQGERNIDYSDTRTDTPFASTMYRYWDSVRMRRSLDTARQKYTAAGGSAAGVYDYDVIDIAAGEWLQYTRTFPAGWYEIYLRQSIVNMPGGESVLERVTGDRTQPDPATEPLGTFLGVRSGFQYRNTPLTDGTGVQKVVVPLSGVTTLRLRQVTPDASDAARYQNYLVFIPVPDPGQQRASVVALSPAPDSEVRTVEPAIAIEIRNKDTSVRTDSIVLQLNGEAVTAQVQPTAQGAFVNYDLVPLPPSGATQTARVTFRDSEDVEVASEWSFTVVYASLDPGTRVPGPGLTRGLDVRVVQAPAGSNLENSLLRAEAQLAPNSTIPKYYETNVVSQVINYSESGPGSASGYFADDLAIPGLEPDFNGTDDIAMEAVCWLELNAGIHRFGVRSDDGFKVVGGTRVNDPAVPALGFRSGGTADMVFDFVVTAGGLYPFRFVWYERGGDAHVEWFSVDRETGARTLINDPTSAQAIKAYTTVDLTPVDQLFSTADLASGWAVDPGASLNAGTRTFTTPRAGPTRFYQIGGTQQRIIIAIRPVGDQIEIQFE